MVNQDLQLINPKLEIFLAQYILPLMADPDMEVPIPDNFDEIEKLAIKIFGVIKINEVATPAKLYQDIPEFRGDSMIRFSKPEKNLVIWTNTHVNVIPALKLLLSSDLIGVNFFDLDAFKEEKSPYLNLPQAYPEYIKKGYNELHWLPCSYYAKEKIYNLMRQYC